MITEKMLKLWFKWIDNFNISILIAQYKKEIVLKARLDEAKEYWIQDWNEILLKITRNLQKCEACNNKAEKIEIAKEIIRLKVILDLIKDLNYNN